MENRTVENSMIKNRRMTENGSSRMAMDDRQPVVESHIPPRSSQHSVNRGPGPLGIIARLLKLDERVRVVAEIRYGFVD